jgi:hypothetical protein
VSRLARSLSRSSATMLASAVTVLLVGASDAVDDARERLLGMPLLERKQIEESLRRFDQVLTTEQQKSMREIDQRIWKLAPEERVHYLAVLRRYHNWLDSLPESVKNSVLDKPVAERMAVVKSLIPRYPLPDEGTPAWIAVVDNSVGSPIEQAAMFKIWQEMTPEQRRVFEAQPAGNRRPQALLRSYGGNKIIGELTPSNLLEEEWFSKTFARLREYQRVDPELKEMLSKTEIKPDASLPKQKAQEAAEKFRRVRMQRSAVNLYYLNQPPPRGVDPQLLTQFLGAMLPWIRATFDTYPADEARRRLTLVYRIVFPYPNEFKPTVTTGSKAAPAPAVGRGVVPPAPAPVPKPGRAPPRSPTSGTPF